MRVIMRIRQQMSQGILGEEISGLGQWLRAFVIPALVDLHFSVLEVEAECRGNI